MKAIITTAAILSTLFLGACSSAPAEKPVEAAPAASQAPTVSSTPTPSAKAVEPYAAPLASVGKPPANPAAVANIEGLKDCASAVFHRKVFVALSVDPEVPVGHQELVKDYVALVDKRSAELGC